jgi:hypothetical protein
MEVNSQLHATAAIPPGKEPCGSSHILGWLGRRGGLDATEKRKALFLKGSNPGRQVCSQWVYQLSCPNS